LVHDLAEAGGFKPTALQKRGSASSVPPTLKSINAEALHCEFKASLVTIDPFDLERFVSAQAQTIDPALDELRAGRKHGHWMWFVFPQLNGLGRSPTAQRYGISSLAEARAYLNHPILGPRLEAAVAAVQTSPAESLGVLFGAPDDLKLRSSMTLFAIAAPEGPFQKVIDRWCGGEFDIRTLQLLQRGQGMETS
jgi:uncharacterized protein (DUF1810 family)